MSQWQQQIQREARREQFTSLLVYLKWFEAMNRIYNRPRFSE